MDRFWCKKEMKEITMVFLSNGSSSVLKSCLGSCRGWHVGSVFVEDDVTQGNRSVGLTSRHSTNSDLQNKKKIHKI